MDSIELIIQERHRQIYEEGWTPSHDNKHVNGELAVSAACYAMPEAKRSILPIPIIWPWMSCWWKPTPNNRIRELVKAGALIVAEIDRLQLLEKGN